MGHEILSIVSFEAPLRWLLRRVRARWLNDFLRGSFPRPKVRFPNTLHVSITDTITEAA